MQNANIPGNQNMGRHLRLAAYFYPATARKSAVVDFYRINEVSGGKALVASENVRDKRHARCLCRDRGFTPWNF